MSDIFRTVAAMSVSGSIVAFILFALTPVYKNRLSKQLQYYLWLIVIVQLLLPFSWELSLPSFTAAAENAPAAPSITTVRDTVDRLINAAEERTEILSAIPAPSNASRSSYAGAAPETFKNLSELAVSFFSTIIWPVGFAASFLWCVISYISFTVRLKKTLSTACLNAKLPVYKSRLASTPMLIGIFKPMIVLPEKAFSESQLNFIISHELMHYKRGDIIIKWLAAAAVAIHWFNPVVYRIRRELSRACELSCDEAVVKALDSAGKQGYGEALISAVAEGRPPAGAVSTTMCEEKKALKERLVSIMKYKKRSGAVIVLSAISVIAVISCAVILAARSENTPPGTADVTGVPGGEAAGFNPSEGTDSAEAETDGPAEDIIKHNLDIIASSPAFSSNPGSYINEHKAEYEEIITQGARALPYLYAVYERDKGLLGMLAKIAMLEIQPDLNINSVDSPGKNNFNYRIETYGIDFHNPISGIYPAREIRLVTLDTGDVLWSMEPGYLKADFAWSPDGRYAAISYMARTYAETIVLDSATKTLVPIPGLSELAAAVNDVYAPKDDRADPYIWLHKWTYNLTRRLKCTFEWTAKNDEQVVGGFVYDLESTEITEIYADFAVNRPPLDFGEPDSIAIKFNYFNSFAEDYQPYATDDRQMVSLLTDMLSSSALISKFEYDDANSRNNPAAEITLYYGGRQQNLLYYIDTLYSKSAFELDGVYYSPKFDTARLIMNLEGLRPPGVDIDEAVKTALNSYGLDPVFRLSESDIRLPDNLSYKSGEFPTKLYWSYNLELSKDAGLDFYRYLGKTLRAEQYYLSGELPNSFYPQQNAYAAILWDKDKIVGAYLNAGRAGFGCSLTQRTFEDITGLSFESWHAVNGYDLSDQTTVNNALLSPEEVISQYYEALGRGDNSEFQYVSVGWLKSRLYSHRDIRKLYLTDWYDDATPGLGNNVESVKLLGITPNASDKPAGENERIFNIEIDIKYKRELTSVNGIDNLTVWLVKEGAAGWKINAAGH